MIALACCLLLLSPPTTVQVWGLSEPVEILRDRWGIAHIYAKNEHDLFFAQGYNAARDRLFQLELWRRHATGTVAEMLGPQELKIYLTQEGPRVTGHTTSEFGESQVRGTINGQDIQFTFSSTDGGRAIDIRVTARVEGERMRGTAKIGDRAEGAFTAERTDG